MLPHEILLSILDHLDGDSETILSLKLTCKLFRALLTENEPRIAYAVAHKHSSGPVRFLLEATVPINWPPSFSWLSRAYTRGHAIRLLVNVLENAGLYKDQSLFGTNFSIHGRPLVPADYADVRRYVMTMLLAVELCSLSGNTRQKWAWANVGPRWTAGFALLSQDLIRYLVKVLHLCIEGHNALTWGPSDAPSGFFPDETQAEDLIHYLYSGMLLSGARGIVDLLSTTYHSYDQFIAVTRQRLYGDYLERCTQDELWPQQRMPNRLWLLSALKHRRGQERWDATATDDPGATYKDYVGEMDIDEWKKEIPDDEAWTGFVHDNNWSKPMQFTSSQLQKKLPKPIFQPLLDMNGLPIWSAADRKRILAQPLTA